MGVVHTMKRHDLQPSIGSTLTYPGTATSSYPNGIPVDLTDVTSGAFLMRDAYSGSVKVNAAATVVDADSGVVRYDWQGTDTDTASVYLAEWEFIVGGKRLTVPNDGYLIVNIVPDLADATVTPIDEQQAEWSDGFDAMWSDGNDAEWSG